MSYKSYISPARVASWRRRNREADLRERGPMPPTTFEPLYAQVRSRLIARLTAGEWRPGMALPGDSTLASEIGVSPGTVRKAVDSLVADGVLRRHQGKGTFVTEQTPEYANYHFFRLVDAAGERVLPEPRSETVTVRPAGARAARALGLPRGEPITRIERVRAVAGRPAILETIAVPVALMPGLAGETPLPNALYPHYQARHGISVISTDDRLSAVAANAAASEALGVARGSPMLQAERIARDLTGRPVEWRRSRFVCDGLAYAVTLG